MASPGLLSFVRALRLAVPANPRSVQEADGLITALYDASLRFEEGHHLRCLVTCLHYRGAPPKNYLAWNPRTLSSRAVAKIARATDPRSSSLVVQWGAGEWQLVGMIARLPVAPVGIFQVAIEGVAHLSIRVDGHKVAEYLNGVTTTSAPDVLRTGPVHAKLGWAPAQVALVAEVLRRIEGQGIGGALLFDDGATAGAPIQITYSVAHNPYAGLRKARTKGQLELAIWVTTSLSRVDGAVVLTKSLDVLGNGARLGAPPAVAVRTATRSDGKYSKSVHDLGRWGTRHGSMIAYCAARKEAVGFVISEDGGVRAITQVGAEATMWERIRLGDDDLAAGP